MKIDTYFPIKIRITEIDHPDYNKTMIVYHDYVPLGVSFKVLETNVKEVE